MEDAKKEIQKNLEYIMVCLQIQGNLYKMNEENQKTLEAQNLEGLKIFNNYLEQGIELLKDINKKEKGKRKRKIKLRRKKASE